MKLQDARVAITGAAGGLGLAMAERFAKEGANLFLTDVSPEGLERIRPRFPGALFRTLDVSSPASVAEAAEAVRAEWGGLDVLVSNAGVVFGGPVAEVSVERHRLTVDVNLTGTILVTRAFLPLMERSRDFKLVFIASASGYLPLPMAASYAATKWGVRGFAVSIEEELRLRGLGKRRVLTVCPSYIGTGLFAGAQAPFLTPILKTETVAAAVVSAVRANRRLIDLPASVHLLKALARILPDAWYRAFLRISGVSKSMTKWTGHERLNA